MTFRFAYMLSSSSAEVLGFKIYGANPPKIIKWLHRKLFRANDILWKLKHRYVQRYRYNIVDTGLAPGYYDEDYRMLHACMSLLCHYVETGYGGEEALANFTKELQESPDPHAQEACFAQAARQDEALTIYHWWKVTRLANHDYLTRWQNTLHKDQDFGSWVDDEGRHCCGIIGNADETMGTFEQMWEYEKSLDAEDQAMLHRLIDIRKSLWN